MMTFYIKQQFTLEEQSLKQTGGLVPNVVDNF